MGLTTDFNTSPYFDDFELVGSDGLSPKDKYYRILFKPSVSVQARELTQLQSILQEQIERFGNNVLKEGTIVSGGNFVEVNPLPYVKLEDTGTDELGEQISVDPSLYVGMKAVGVESGIEAIIVASATGLETQNPDLNTLYVKYINNVLDGSNQNVGVFNSSEEIQIQYLDANGIWTDYHVVTAAGAVVDNAIGNGYGVRCGEGVIYQKGHFVKFQDELTVVSKYTTNANGVVVGFQTEEQIIDSNQDTSLLDNANGFNNYNAPGADRLMLTPSLVVKTLAEAKADEKFFSIQEYQNGRVVRRRLSTQFNSIEKFNEQITYEESGNYSVNNFAIKVEQSVTDTSKLTISVGQGTAYVMGKRVELVGDIKIDIPEATTSSTITGQDIVANYGHYVLASAMSGYFPIGTFSNVSLYTGGSATGSAKIRDIERQADGNYRLYLFDIAMNPSANFDTVTSVRNGANTATLDSSTVYDYSFKSAIFPIGRDFIDTINATNTSYTYRATNTLLVAGTDKNITLTTSGGDTLPYSVGALNTDQLRDFVVICNETQAPYTLGQYINIASATVNSSTSITLTLTDAPAAAMDVIVHYNAVKTGNQFNEKTLKRVYVKVDTATHPNTNNGEYVLGVPDAYEIEGIWQGTTYAETNTNVTDQFVLYKNQKDTYYGLSYIKKKKNHTIAANAKLLIKVKAFHKTSGSTFFTVNSYAPSIDDASVILPADKIRTENIPTYTAEDGSEYYLRDVIDCRPHAANTAVYSTTAASATINPASTVSFSTVNFVAPNKSIEVEYDYYLGRNDRLVIDENGNFEVIAGTPSDNPTIPSEPAKSMSLALFRIPPYPSLPSSVANLSGKPSYGVSVSKINNRRYTMKDVGQLDNRLKNLEYYVSLSLLEKNAKDLVITDANGLDRFKNGILVENFENFAAANVKSAEFAAGIDPAYKEATPKFRSYPIDLKLSTDNSNVTDFGETVTLNKTDSVVIDQPYATDVKSCTTDYYKFNGAMVLFPAYDTGPDTSRAPDINFDIDLATPFAEFAEALSEFVPLQSVTREVVNTTTKRSGGFLGFFRRRTTTNTILETTRTLTVGEDVTTQNIGDFVTNTEFSAYMRSREIEVSVSGLRPNTRFYFYFDGRDVNEHVAKGTLVGNNVIRSTDYGSQVITSDSEGKLYAMFRIPEGQFFVGDRTLEIFDVAAYGSKDASTSYASRTYSGFNFSVEKTGLAATTRNASIDVVETTRTFTQTRRRGGSDPIAQTFIIDSEASSDNSVMITKLDLFFATKSTVGNGINVQIREVQNGYPSGVVVPFSEVHIDADSVSANTTVATNATTVTFTAPVALKTDTEYAIVVAPDANDPDYRVWISRTGGVDVDTGVSVSQDTNAGVLFTSTNNKTWTPYQNENLKFNLYKASFTQATGYATLTNKDHEFLELSGITGQFLQREKAFIQGSNLTGTIAVTAGSTTITGVSTLFDAQLTVGEHIVYKPTASTYQLLKINTINSNTSLTVADIPFSSNSAANFYKSPVGDVVYFTTIEPKVIILENSTAKNATYMFEAGDVIVGAESGSTATIVNVLDQKISYLQPTVARSNFMTTRTDISASKLWNGSAIVSKNIEFNDNNYFIDEPIYVRSRSNEIANSTGKTFELKVDMSSTSNSTKDTSPMVDYQNSGVTIYEYLINSDSTDEDTPEGNATSKYITKSVTLADGLDADDMRVYLTAYRPPTTNIEVYVRFQNSTDSRNFEEIEWTKLQVKGETSLVSSIADRFDYKEFEFYLGDTILGNGEGAYINASNVLEYKSSTGSVYNSYKNFAVKVVMLSDGHNTVPRVKDLRAIALT